MPQGKRGQALEECIIQSNKTYKLKGLALVDKVPTPWTVHYDKRTGRVIRAFPREKGTVDFVGISHGRGIAFDAKSTKETTRFPLKNIEQHQIDYLLQHKDQGGISFFIIDFSKKDERYYVPIEKMAEWWEDQFKGGRKSIPYEWFYLNCERIMTGNGAVINYLKHCNTAFKQSM
jgi:recombination protein U